MKVYKSLIELKMNVGLVMCEPNELLYEKGDIYQPEKGSYPVAKETVENNSSEFEFVRNDEHDADYYLLKKYTQYEFDQISKGEKP